MLQKNVSLDHKTILVTGAAGFIGSFLAADLLKSASGATIVGFDNLNDRYAVSLKERRLADLEKTARACGENRWVFRKGDLADRDAVDRLFSEYPPDLVVHLAAQTGVRHSVQDPGAFIEANIVGFFHLLEACRRAPVEHLVFASSSSVYGGNEKVPFGTEDRTDAPVSLYAATKKSGELMAHAYSKLYDVPTTALRFFTVYGPAGRPDMAYFSFAEKLRRGEPIQIFNYGNCQRDFTYVDDVTEAIRRVMQHAPERAAGADGLPVPPYKVYNIGGSRPENLLDFVRILTGELKNAGVLDKDGDYDALRQLVPMQPGDVPVTCADVEPLETDFGFRPEIGLREGLRRFAQWYAQYLREKQNND